MEAIRNSKAYGKTAAVLHRESYGYRFGIKDVSIVLAEGAALSVMVSFLFYDDIRALLLSPLIMIWNLFRFRGKKTEERRSGLVVEFRELLKSVSSSLSAGYSVENAFAEAEESLEKLFGKHSILQGDVHYLNNKVKMGVPIEKQFMGLVKKYPVEEIRTFGELFLFCKRMGGDYTKNIRRLAVRIDEGIAMKEEILGMVAEKQLELQIMSVVPFGIIFYMRLTAADFMAPLYQNIAGVFLMSICLGLYVASMVLGKKMIRSSLEV